MTNGLLNPSFESGWYHPVEGALLSGWHHMRCPEEGEQGVGEFQIPENWDFKWADATVTNPYWDGEAHNLFVAPEIIHRSREHLPEHEWDDFILDGDWTLKVFGKAWCAGFSQIPYLEKGTYRFTVRLFPDLVSSYKNGKQWALDPKSGNLRFVLNGKVAPWMQLKSGEKHEQHLTFSAGGITTVGFDLLCPFALANSGFFIDNLTLERVEEPESPPDRQYDRVVHLLPQDATATEVVQVVKAASPSKQSISWSVDDAFVTAPALKTRTVCVWDVMRITVDQATLEEWVERFYPPLPKIYYRYFAQDPAPLDWQRYLLWQRDPQWRDTRFGSVGYRPTIGDEGCYISALGMAMRIFGLDVDATPVTVDEALGTEGYAPGTARALWSAIKAKLNINIWKGTELDAIQALDHGDLVMAEVLPASLEHFVLVVKELNDSDYLMLDPYKNTIAPLHDHYDGVESWRVLSPVEESPPPLPPPPNELLTLHLQTPVPGWDDYVSAVKPGWVKLIGGIESGRIVKALSPHTNVLYRHHLSAGDQGKYLDGVWDADHFLDRFWDTVVANAPFVDAIEGLNETIATGDMPGIRKAVDFAVRFADALAARCDRSGIERIAPCLLNVAVGNPQRGYEEEKLIPAARAAIKYGGWLSYHAYFPAHVDHAERWLEEEGVYHHMRALESWDVTFAKRGLAPRYLFTESGAIGVTVRPDGRPGTYGVRTGWRWRDTLNGDLPRYIRLQIRFRDMVNRWNSTHDNRAEAIQIFTSGIGKKWRYFLMNEHELAALAEALA